MRMVLSCIVCDVVVLCSFVMYVVVTEKNYLFVVVYVLFVIFVGAGSV